MRRSDAKQHDNQRMTRGGGAGWEAEGGHQATQQPTQQEGRDGATRGGGAGWGSRQGWEGGRQEVVARQNREFFVAKLDGVELLHYGGRP